MEDPVLVGLIVLAALVASALLWRPYRGRRRSLEEVLEARALEQERERAFTDASEAANRYNMRPPGR